MLNVFSNCVHQDGVFPEIAPVRVDKRFFVGNAVRQDAETGLGNHRIHRSKDVGKKSFARDARREYFFCCHSKRTDRKEFILL